MFKLIKGMFGVYKTLFKLTIFTIGCIGITLKSMFGFVCKLIQLGILDMEKELKRNESKSDKKTNTR